MRNYETSGPLDQFPCASAFASKTHDLELGGNCDTATQNIHHLDWPGQIVRSDCLKIANSTLLPELPRLKLDSGTPVKHVEKKPDKSILEFINDHVVQITYPDSSVRKFSYDSNGTPIKFIEPTGTTWLKQNDSAKWTSNKGTTWYGQVEVNKDGDYSFAGRDDHKLHIIGSNGCERILRPSQDFGQIVQQHFTQLDTDGDGWLSKREINAAMQNPTIKGELAQAVSALKEHQNELMKLSNDEWFFENDGVTATDIIEFDRLQKNVTQQQSSESVTSKLVNGIDWTMGYARDVLKQTSRALYNDKVNPVASIASKAVRQGFVGDCAYMGTLSAVAAFNPQSIVKMIEEKGKEFKVTFPGAKDKPVTVSAPTEPELARYASGHKYGLWVPVVEKALGEFERKRSVGWSVPDLAHEAIDDGQYLDYTLQLLTGKKIEITGITLGVEDTIHAKLKEACLAKYPVVADIEPGTPNCRGLVGNHTYTILSYDAQKHIVTVRNPWGFGEIKRPDGGARDGTDDGVFRMSLVEFCSSFKSICVATE